MEELRIRKWTTPMREWGLGERDKDVVAMSGIHVLRWQRQRSRNPTQGYYCANNMSVGSGVRMFGFVFNLGGRPLLFISALSGRFVPPLRNKFGSDMVDLWHNPTWVLPESHREHAEVIHSWLVEFGASCTEERRILNCLNNQHLLSLLRSSQLACLPKVLKATHF